jgi:hypothetical protein
MHCSKLSAATVKLVAAPDSVLAGRMVMIDQLAVNTAGVSEQIPQQKLTLTVIMKLRIIIEVSESSKMKS